MATMPNAKFTAFALETNVNRADIYRVADGIENYYPNH